MQQEYHCWSLKNILIGIKVEFCHVEGGIVCLSHNIIYLYWKRKYVLIEYKINCFKLRPRSWQNSYPNLRFLSRQLLRNLKNLSQHVALKI